MCCRQRRDNSDKYDCGSANVTAAEVHVGRPNLPDESDLAWPASPDRVNPDPEGGADEPVTNVTPPTLKPNDIAGQPDPHGIVAWGGSLKNLRPFVESVDPGAKPPEPIPFKSSVPPRK